MRLIDADKAIEYAEDLYLIEYCTEMEHEIHSKIREAIIDFISEQPTADVEPVVHGYWTDRNGGCCYPRWERFECSVCGKHSDNYDYCPHCGAEMKED